MERKRKLEVDDMPSKKQETAAVAYVDPTGGINPYTGKPYSKRYYDILQKRTGELTADHRRCACANVAVWILHVGLKHRGQCCMKHLAFLPATGWAHATAATQIWGQQCTFQSSLLSSSTLKPPVMRWSVLLLSPQACLSGRPRKTL